ncbi:uncharacterized protein P174DRAFT_491121 [Aspergillus novofumigatus IBT 16806]|uniref:DUF4238 domain-containing protein n=1 Tax=Aspergillus novofumigatus (strain IBT 16806) TaxID=1392255 RepID=A0A2I1C165_ASPN1|nr:uncharacterized protein P174DRAFT_491121 [Aspergillus novofumigatus IBT 16806]PKX91372.1 hypothetical protein P174DRAFT_491121 [Aspergillus novofumigatus IBT 16806]
MAPETVTQYHHYIPRFILKRFEHTRAKSKNSTEHGIVHVFDLVGEQFWLKEVAKTCGTQNLYYNAMDTNPMRVEHLFSKLESKTSVIFNKVTDAVSNGVDHIDILEKDVHLLFQFMNLSLRRSEWYRDEVKNPYRENDFFFQRHFEASRKSGRSSEPEQYWLEQLLYLLETSHEDILEDAKNPDENAAAYTYRHFVENYALQIWKAANGYEFFLNDRLVDFEGDTQSYLGTEMKGKRCQLIWMTSEDLIHLILPVSPEVAIIFCNESRCWESPFADAMLQAKVSYPENSLLKNAPHKDIVSVDVPSRKRGRKKWPATVAWRVNIGALSREQHRIIASYSLSHARLLIVVRSRARFERAKRELELFSRERMEHWSKLGIRSSYRGSQQQSQGPVLQPASEEASYKSVEEFMSALYQMLEIKDITHEVPSMTKKNAFRLWVTIDGLERSAGRIAPSVGSEKGCPASRIMHPALKAAFEAKYPPKHPNHKDLNNVNFAKFFDECIGEETFRLLSLEIEREISKLVSANSFKAHFEACKKTLPHYDDPLVQQRGHDASDQCTDLKDDILRSPQFQSIIKVAEIFDVLKWMFDERQDILATFVRQIAVPMDGTRPRVVRFRGRRE